MLCCMHSRHVPVSSRVGEPQVHMEPMYYNYVDPAREPEACLDRRSSVLCLVTIDGSIKANEPYHLALVPRQVSGKALQSRVTTESFA